MASAAFSESAVDSAIRRAAEKLGYSKLCHQLVRAVKNFVQGNDIFVSQPTGSGKSLCYCILPATFNSFGADGRSISVIVSSLISLMKDQVRAMEWRGTRVVYVGDCSEERREVEVCCGNYQLVYMSPEALLMDETWRDMLVSPVYRQYLVALVVDEAHCVKKW